MPGPRHGAAEGMYPALGIDGDLVRVGKHHPRGANGGKGLAVPDHDCSHGSGSVVPGAAHHGSAGLQPGKGRRPLGHHAGDLRGLVHLGKQSGIDVQLFQHFLAPAAVRHVQQLHAGSVGDLGGKLPGEHVAHIVLGQQDVGALGVQLRLMLADPQNLRGGKARQGRVGGDLNQPLLAHPLGDLLALGGGALVTPDDGPPQHLALLVQHHQAVHLAGNAHALDVPGVHAAFLKNRPKGLAGGVPPVQRLLLGPAVAFLIHGIFHRSAGHHLALPVEKHRLCAAGSQVDANYIFHTTPVLSPANSQGEICLYILYLYFPRFSSACQGKRPFFHDFFPCGTGQFVLF